MNRMAAPAAILLLIVLLGAGCISFHPPSSGGTMGGPGTAPTETVTGPLPPGVATPRTSLSDALAALPAAGETIDLKGLTLTKVWGYGVDSSGLASTWVLGMKGAEKTVLVTCSNGEYQVQDLPLSLPEDEVRIGELITPQELFRQNLNPIVMEMNRRRTGECDLTLDATSYQVTILSPSGSSTLSFDARKGASAGSLPPNTMEGGPPVTGMQTPGVLPPPAGTHPAVTPGRIALPALVPLGAVALAILGLRRRC